MRKRIWLSGAMAALGAACLAAAVFAGTAASKPSKPVTAGQKKGGTMNINMSATDVDYIDPALAYGTNSWQILDAVCVKLFYYPDKAGAEGSKLTPEASDGFPKVSADGKTYTFTVKKGFKFNTGPDVTPKNFAYAINRALNPAMQSPAVPFISGIVGADDVVNKKATTARGVTVQGDKLIIKLTAPDGSLLPKLAMDFFCAIPLDLPINPDGVDTFAGAGPYYVASRQVGRQIILQTNKNYKGTRPHNISTFVFTVNTNVDQSLLQVKAGQSDYDAGGMPPTAHASLGEEFGLNKGRYFVSAGLNVDYVAMNTARPAFANATMRKGANHAIDRPAMLRVRGKYAGKRTDQILPPGLGGFVEQKLYPIQGSDYAKAKELAGKAGGCKDVTLYSATSPTGQLLAQVMKYNLTQMGCNVTVKLFQGFQIYIAAGTKGEPFDAVVAGWFADYTDPYDFIDILLNGENIHEANNNNLAYLNVAALNKQMADANKLTGDARYAAYGKLDLVISRDHAPWMAYDNRNTREFVSARTGGYTYSLAHGLANLNNFYLK